MRDTIDDSPQTYGKSRRDLVSAARVLFPWLGLPAFIAELWLALWLAVKGVSLPRWNEIVNARAVNAA